MCKKYILFTLAIASAAGAHADGGSTVGEYLRDRTNGVMQVYVAGMGKGYQMANAVLMAKNQPPLYCEGKKGLNRDDYLAIVDREISIRKPHPDEMVVVMLAMGLERSFPCK